MHSRLLVTVALASLGALAGCAHSQSPVLYPNAKLQQVGKEQADRDVNRCLRERGYEVVGWQ
jgi:predicted GTPase